MNLPTEKTQNSKVRVVIRGNNDFRTSAAAMMIALGFGGNHDQIAVVDTNSNFTGFFHKWGFSNVLPAPPPCTVEKLLEQVEACENKPVVVVDSLNTFWDTLIDMNRKEDGINWPEVLRVHQLLLKRLMDSHSHIIMVIKTHHPNTEGVEVFGPEELAAKSIFELQSILKKF